MRSFVSLALLLLFGASLAPAQVRAQERAQVRVWQGTLRLPASDEGAPDPNPPFDLFLSKNFSYPYTIREGVRNTESVHDWRAVYLENEFLKCSVLPDLGGHVYTCIDKINGKPMFYANPSIKKALIGYRGAWSAFGIEFDFPISHNWVTLSPVDFAYASHPDGSASVTVGTRDRVYGMEWTVELVLRPGSTVLEERVTLSNPSDLRHRFYWWNNAGVQVWNDSRILYPMQFTAAHGFKDIDTWPVDSSGKDMSLIANQTDGEVSRFVYGSREPFMGIYNPHTDAGLVHYANYADLPAKKIWSWGVDREGLDWRKTLSDNDSAYVEVQAGLFRNQETYAFLEPGQTIHFSEFWMPVRSIGTITYANLHGVLALTRTAQADGKTTLHIGFNANDEIPDAQVLVLNGDKSIFNERTSLDPSHTYTHQIENLPQDARYTFVLKSATGETLLEHTEGKYDWTPRDQVHTGPQPAYQPPPQEAWSDGDFLSHGRDQELNGNPIAAAQTYSAGLAKFPSSSALLKAMGRIDVALFRYQEAASLLGQVGLRATSDAEIHYYRGIAEAALGNTGGARDEFETARRSPSFRAPAGLLLAELLARNHDVAGALATLQQSCPSAPSNLRCTEETAALERLAGHPDSARRLAREALLTYPTSSFLRNELRTPGSADTELDRHLAADTSRILNLAIEYIRLGMYADALDLLSRDYPKAASDESEPAAVPPSNDPLLAYYRGYCRQKLGQPGEPDFDVASGKTLSYVFPNQPESIPVLQAALVANPSDASAHFLLGMLWFSRGLVDPALEEWQRAESLNPKIPTLDASLGRALLDVKNKPDEAATVFQHGLQSDPANPAIYLGLDQAMRRLGQSASLRAAMLKHFPDRAGMTTALVRALVDDLREDGRDDEADALLAQHFLPRKEGEEPLQPKAQTK
jgi:tetratricopeptide (TPR) repeat protein